MQKTTIALIFTASFASAQSWNDRGGDIVLNETELTERLVGQSIVFFDDGESSYSADGRYSYTYDGGATAYGVYSLKPDGVVCVDFENGFARCDRFVLSGDRLVLQTEKGERFPIRP